MTTVYINPQIQALRALYQQIHEAATDNSLFAILERQANGIVRAHRAGNDAVCFHLGSWCPDFQGLTAARMMARELSLEQARLTVAREYGFGHWSSIAKLTDRHLDCAFEQAVDKLLAGDIAYLSQALARDPSLARQRSGYGHGATLLHYLGANGVESHRQVTPMNAVELGRCLLQAGANVNASANIYGGCNTLALVNSSAHPADAGLTGAIAALLIEAGSTQ